MEFKSKETENAFHNIIDTFTFADGGIKFVNFRTMIWDMDNRADDPAAEKIIDFMLKFSKLIDLANEG